MLREGWLIVTEAPSEEEHAAIADTQQQVIMELLEECSGWPEDRIAARLRQALEARGVPAPDPWLRAVAGDIAEDLLYVVSNGSVASDYFSSPTAHRAADRNSLKGRDLQPSKEARHEDDEEGKAPGNQVV